MNTLLRLGAMILAGRMSFIFGGEASVWLAHEWPLMPKDCFGINGGALIFHLQPYSGAVVIFAAVCLVWFYILPPLLGVLPDNLMACLLRRYAVTQRAGTKAEGQQTVVLTFLHVTPRRKALYNAASPFVALGVLALVYHWCLPPSPFFLPAYDLPPVMSTAGLAMAAGVALRLAQNIAFLRCRTVVTFGPDTAWSFQGKIFDLWASRFDARSHDRATSEQYAEQDNPKSSPQPQNHKYREALMLAALTPYRTNIGEFSDHCEAESALIALQQVQRSLLEHHGLQPSYG